MKAIYLAKFVYLIVFIVLTLYLATHGQKKSFVKKAVTPTAVIYDTKPLDTKVLVLPKLYAGHDIEAITTQIFEIRKRVQKGEFETSAEFDKRKSASIAKFLPNNLPIDSTLAFPISLKQSSLEYNADEQLLYVFIFTGQVSKGYEYEGFYSDKISIPIKSRIAAQQESIITTRVFEEFALAFNKDDHNFQEGRSSKNFQNTVYFAVRMPLATAKQIKNNLRLLLTCKIVDPFAKKGEFTAKPSPETLRETFVYTDYLYVAPHEIWIYDYTTGAVYEKIPVKPAFEDERQSETERKDSKDATGSSKNIKPNEPSKDVVEPLRIISRPKPIYTEAARQNQVTGVVRLNVTFLASGQIGDIVPVNRLTYGLTEAAVDAAKQIKFVPQRINGTPQMVTKQIEYSFMPY